MNENKNGNEVDCVENVSSCCEYRILLMYLWFCK